MTIPNKGWLPIPLLGAITAYTLPVVFPVYYYVCNPGPYDPLQPYELPIIRAIEVNEIPFANSGYKNGAWGWVAGIHWAYAYGDALIDWVYPPLDPTSLDDPCPDNVIDTDDGCPTGSTITPDQEAQPVVITETRTATAVIDDRTAMFTLVSETVVVPLITPDDNPA